MKAGIIKGFTVVEVLMSLPCVVLLGGIVHRLMRQSFTFHNGFLDYYFSPV